MATLTEQLDAVELVRSERYGNLEATAKHLGIPSPTLMGWVREHGLNAGLEKVRREEARDSGEFDRPSSDDDQPDGERPSRFDRSYPAPTSDTSSEVDVVVTDAPAGPPPAPARVKNDPAPVPATKRKRAPRGRIAEDVKRSLLAELVSGGWDSQAEFARVKGINPKTLGGWVANGNYDDILGDWKSRPAKSGRKPGTKNKPKAAKPAPKPAAKVEQPELSQQAKAEPVTAETAVDSTELDEMRRTVKSLKADNKAKAREIKRLRALVAVYVS